MSLSISKAWEETKAVLASDGRLMVAVALALLVLPSTLLGAFAPVTADQITPTFEVLLLVAIVAAIGGQIALNRLAIPPSSTVGAGIGRAFRRTPAALVALIGVFFAAFICAFILIMIAVLVGVVEAPVSGRPPPMFLIVVIVTTLLAVFAIFQLIMPVAAAESGGPFHLISRSWVLAKSNYWRLAAYLILALVGMIFIWMTAQLIAGLTVTGIFGPPERGSIGVLLVSLIVALIQSAWTIVTSVMIARIYVQLSGRDTVEEPRIGT